MFDLKKIKTKERHHSDKYSWNLYRDLKENPQCKVYLRKRGADERHYLGGFDSEYHCFHGSQLTRVLAGNMLTYAWPLDLVNIDEVTDVTEAFIKEYEERAWEVIETVGLKDRADTLAKTLPHGDQRKLELGMILAPDSEVLLLDEPTAGMAAEQVPELIALIQNIQKTGNKTVMLVEHNMNVVMSVSDQITVMHQGQVLAEGTPSEIAANEAVQRAYLGGLYELNI